VNFRLVGPEIAYIVGHCEARAMIVQDALCETVEAIRDQLPIDAGRFVRFQGPGAGVGARTGTSAGTGNRTDTSPGRPGSWQDYESLLSNAAGTPPDVAVGPRDPFALMYTSGTTGRPKGAIRNHGGNALIAMATALEFGFRPRDTALLVMPMCHANSLYFALTFIYRGGTCVVHDARSFDPEELLATLASERITFTSLVPTHYIMMLGLPDAVKARHDVGSVEKLLISSAPARRETKLEILGHFKNSSLYELYGSTEAGWVTLVRPEEQLERLGSVGREWAGSGPIRLLDPNGAEVADGEVGELFSRTAYVFDGYWNDPAKTGEAFRGEWCSVGDMARRDADGFIHLVDRKSNMIISGGENVYPSEVETAIGAHPEVRDVAVVGLPDAKWGEAVTAVVVPRHAGAIDEAAVLAWCRDRLAGYKRPRRVIVLDEAQMPRTATGKILHRVLRERLAAGQAQTVTAG
jgi:acyl-CoA synthetase (AMP-forming)/AMP-acid ligase II